MCTSGSGRQFSSNSFKKMAMVLKRKKKQSGNGKHELTKSLTIGWCFRKEGGKKRKEKQESVQKGRRQARKRLKRAGIYEHVLGIFVS